MAYEVDIEGFLRALGTQIKQLRDARGWSNRDIFVMHGIDDSQWRRYERGGGLSLASLLRIAMCFDMSLMELLDTLGQFPKKSISDLQQHEVQRSPAKKPTRKRPAKKVTSSLKTSQ